MTIIDRYVARSVLAGSLLVLAALVALRAVVGVLRQLENVGTGSYGMLEALTFVVTSLPRHAYEFLPIATLLGALLGLGGMAAHSELVVMRAAGISIWRLARGAFVTGIGLAVVGFLLGDIIGPVASDYGQRLRTLSLNQGVSLADGRSTWIKDGGRIIHLEARDASEEFGGVYVFSLDPSHRLVSVARARTADFDDGGNLRLRDYRESAISEKGVTLRQSTEVAQATQLRAELIDLSVNDADKLPLLPLYSYIDYLKRNDLDTYSYEVAFWSRLSNLGALAMMGALALPFVFGPLRSAASGQRVFVGVVIGVVYFVGSRTVLGSGAVLGVDPFVLAWLPTLLLALVLAVSFRRVR
ncbi:MAG: LPS export ABC transporter permease LptG [Pseudomonadota bacterium]